MTISERIDQINLESSDIETDILISSIFEESVQSDKINATSAWLDKMIEAINSWESDISSNINYKLKELRKLNRERIDMHKAIGFYDVNTMTDTMNAFIKESIQILDKWFGSIWNKKAISDIAIKEIMSNFNAIGSKTQKEIKESSKRKIKLPTDEAYKFLTISLSSAGECTSSVHRFFVFIKGLSTKMSAYAKSIENLPNMGSYNARVDVLKQIINSSIFMVRTAYTTIVKCALNGITAIK